MKMYYQIMSLEKVIKGWWSMLAPTATWVVTGTITLTESVETYAYQHQLKAERQGSKNMLQAGMALKPNCMSLHSQ